MYKTLSLLLLATFLFPFNVYGGDCQLYYEGLNPINQAAPLIKSVGVVKADSLNEEDRQERQAQIEKINSLGVDAYISRALEGTEKDSIRIGEKLFNLLDLALIRKADEDIVSKLLNVGYSLSPDSIPLLFKVYESIDAINLIEKTSPSALHSLTIKYNGGEYSIVNLLLLKKDYKAIEYLKTEYNLDILSNASLGNMINIGGLNLDEKIKVSSVINIAEYMELYDFYKKLDEKRFYEKEEFEQEFKYYILAHNCSEPKNLDFKNVKYAVRASKIQELLEELNFEIVSSNVEKIKRLIDNPIIEEYLVKIATDSDRELEPKRKAKFMRNFYALSSHRKIDLLNDKDFFYINKDGITLNEHLFLKGKVPWVENSVEMRINRLANYLVNNGSLGLSVKELKSKLNELNSIMENGKNFSYYLLKYSQTKRMMSIVDKNFPLPESQYGLNPVEMLRIKSELDPKLEGVAMSISNALSNRYQDRL